MKNLLFFLSRPLSKRDFYRFEIDKIESANIKLYICDLSKVLGFCDSYQNPFQPNLNHLYFDNLENLTHDLSKLNLVDTFVAFFFPFNFKTRATYLTISKMKIKYINLYLTPISVYPNNFKYYLKRVFYYLWKKIEYNLTPSDLILHAGSKNNKVIFFTKTNKKTVYISVSSLDFINNFNLKRTKKNKKKYFVFIDEIYPDHPDMKSKLIEPEFYYNKINLIIESIEKKYKLKGIVLLHPRSNENRNLLFNSNSIKNNSAELIKSAEFVVGHSSTAFSYAVINLKPIIQIKFKINQKYYMKVLQSYNLDLNTSILDETDGFNLSKINLNVDTIKYGKYVSKYLSPSTKPIRYSKKLIEYINKS